MPFMGPLFTGTARPHQRNRSPDSWTIGVSAPIVSAPIPIPTITLSGPETPSIVLVPTSTLSAPETQSRTRPPVHDATPQRTVRSKASIDALMMSDINIHEETDNDRYWWSIHRRVILRELAINRGLGADYRDEAVFSDDEASEGDGEDVESIDSDGEGDVDDENGSEDVRNDDNEKLAIDTDVEMVDCEDESSVDHDTEMQSNKDVEMAGEPSDVNKETGSEEVTTFAKDVEMFHGEQA